MTMFLAIDSSAGTQVALVDPQGVTRAEASSDNPRGHAEVVGVLLERVFAEAGLTPSELTHVVMGIGPGPFTGLRVGMAAASAFAQSRSLPLLPVISHDACGWGVSEDTVVITDARRGEVAYSVYRASDSLERIAGPLLARPETLDDDLGAHASATRVVTEEIPAAMLAKVARDFLASGREFPKPAPQYLRSPDVTMPK